MQRWSFGIFRPGLTVFCFLVLSRLNCAYAQNAVILPPGQVGTAYSAAIKTEGGQPPFTWQAAGGSLPEGLQVSVQGKIEGTPRVSGTDPFTFDVRVSDSSKPAQSFVQQFSIVIRPAPLRIVGLTSAQGHFRIVAVSDSATNSAANSPASSSLAVDPPSVTESSSSKIDSPASLESSSKQGAGNDGGAGSSDTKDWEARAIVGYHQAGASSAKFTQNFFFDFFIMRALSSKHLWEGRWNLWGDVRVASSPQQVTTGVGQFATNFATQVSNLPVNELALSADFQTGLEYRLRTWALNGGGQRTIGLISSFGAMGVFQPPDAQMQIFNVPDKTSLQFPAFASQFPSAANAKFVGFVPPNRERFYRSYGVGFRLTTFDKPEKSADQTPTTDKVAPPSPPAIYALTVGQDEAITAGTFSSVVGKIDVFYPLPFSKVNGTYKFLFLFGTANLRLSKATSVPTFGLQNPNANGTTVQPFDPNLAIITVPSKRDTYRIGVGMDLVNLIQSITAPKGTKSN